MKERFMNIMTFSDKLFRNWTRLNIVERNILNLTNPYCAKLKVETDFRDQWIKIKNNERNDTSIVFCDIHE